MRENVSSEQHMAEQGARRLGRDNLGDAEAGRIARACAMPFCQLGQACFLHMERATSEYFAARDRVKDSAGVESRHVEVQNDVDLRATGFAHVVQRYENCGAFATKELAQVALDAAKYFACTELLFVCDVL